MQGYILATAKFTSSPGERHEIVLVSVFENIHWNNFAFSGKWRHFNLAGTYGILHLHDHKAQKGVQIERIKGLKFKIKSIIIIFTEFHCLFAYLIPEWNSSVPSLQTFRLASTAIGQQIFAHPNSTIARETSRRFVIISNFQA